MIVKAALYILFDMHSCAHSGAVSCRVVIPFGSSVLRNGSGMPSFGISRARLAEPQGKPNHTNLRSGESRIKEHIISAPPSVDASSGSQGASGWCLFPGTSIPTTARPLSQNVLESRAVPQHTSIMCMLGSCVAACLLSVAPPRPAVGLIPSELGGVTVRRRLSEDTGASRNRPSRGSNSLHGARFVETGSLCT